MQDLAELMKSMREVLLEIFPGKVIYRSNVPGAKGKDTWVEDWDEEGGCAMHRGPIAERQKPPFPVSSDPSAVVDLYANTDCCIVAFCTWIPTH
jgi:hypothetical protein